MACYDVWGTVGLRAGTVGPCSLAPEWLDCEAALETLWTFGGGSDGQRRGALRLEGSPGLVVEGRHWAPVGADGVLEPGETRPGETDVGVGGGDLESEGILTALQAARERLEAYVQECAGFAAYPAGAPLPHVDLQHLRRLEAELERATLHQAGTAPF